jgi:ribonuclease BN (tRNA processing enzyme)
MISVLFLGTGPGDVAADRMQSSLLLRYSGGRVLIDAGEPCSQRLRSHGIPLSTLEAVFLTHAHADHSGGLPLLCQAAWLEGREAELPVRLPEHLVGPFQAWMAAIFLDSAVLGFPLVLGGWRAGCAESFGGLTVTPHPTTHLDRMKARRPEASGAEAFLLEVECDGRRLVFSGDLGSAEDLRVVLGRPLDLLVCELAHVSEDDLIGVLKDVAIDVLCLTHLSREASERRSGIATRFDRELPKTRTVYLAEDGQAIDLG